MPEALRAYTSGSAFASRAEHLKGSITPGKLADLVVLSQDPTVSAPRKSPASPSWPPTSMARPFDAAS